MYSSVAQYQKYEPDKAECFPRTNLDLSNEGNPSERAT